RLAGLPSAAFEILALDGEAAPAAEANEAPAVAVSAAGADAGRTGELPLARARAAPVDYWAVARDHDGRISRPRFRASRRAAKERVPLTALHTYAEAGRRRIAVQIAGAGGQERREVIDADFTAQ